MIEMGLFGSVKTMKKTKLKNLRPLPETALAAAWAAASQQDKANNTKDSIEIGEYKSSEDQDNISRNARPTTLTYGRNFDLSHASYDEEEKKGSSLELHLRGSSEHGQSVAHRVAYK